MLYTTVLHAVRKQFGLSCNEYCIADMVYHLSANPAAPVAGWCSQSRGNMAKEMDLSRQSVITILQRLEEKGIVVRHRETEYVRTTQLWYDAVQGCKETLQGVKKLDTSISKETLHSVKNVDTPCQESLQDGCQESLHNNKSIDNKSNKEEIPVVTADAVPVVEGVKIIGVADLITPKNVANYAANISDAIRLDFLEKSRGREFPNLLEFARAIRAYRESLKPPQGNMKRPTLEELSSYMKQKGMSATEAETFYNYYESNGWHVGKKPMQKWKAAVATWKNSPIRNQTRSPMNQPTFDPKSHYSHELT